MNVDTSALIGRPYQEIVDDILTAMVGGVVNEEIFYDVKEDAYPLAQRAGDVRSVTGTRDRQHYAFQKNVDFAFDTGANSVVWQTRGARPDDETKFYVDYFRPDATSPLTDINVGSVTRTISEAISREIATVYAQITQAYLAGFVDTATGQSLDLVVAILGIRRKTKEFAGGLVTFFRDPAVQGNVTILENTQLSTAKGATFVTSELRTLQRGQVRIDVPVRATEASQGPAGLVGANEIVNLAQPMAGIARVTNLEPTIQGGDDETDDQLRARARAVLRGLGKATLFALAQAISGAGGDLAEVWDPNGPAGKTSPAGSVTLLVQTAPDRFPDVQGAVDETRAAGVLATVVAQFVFFKPRLAVRIRPGLTAAGKLKVAGEIIDAVQGYVDTLKAGDAAKGDELLKAVKAVKDAVETRIVDVMAWRADVGHPVTATLVDALLDTVKANQGADEAALRTALTAVVTSALDTAPTARRIADRGLVKSTAPERQGQRASDADIEAGKFQVTPPDGSWWVALDLEQADIMLVEGS